MYNIFNKIVRLFCFVLLFHLFDLPDASCGCTGRFIRPAYTQADYRFIVYDKNRSSVSGFTGKVKFCPGRTVETI